MVIDFHDGYQPSKVSFSIGDSENKFHWNSARHSVQDAKQPQPTREFVLDGRANTNDCVGSYLRVTLHGINPAKRDAQGKSYVAIKSLQALPEYARPHRSLRRSSLTCIPLCSLV